MILKSEILELLYLQNIATKESATIAFSTEQIEKLIKRHRLITISGIVGSGKTNLYFSSIKKEIPHSMYINFAHPGFYHFEDTDQYKLDEIIEESESKVLFFDEIQKIGFWKTFLAQKLGQGYKIIVTSSDNSIANVDIDGCAPGDIKNLEWFPLSFEDFCQAEKVEKNAETVQLYMKQGGLPRNLNSESEEYLHQFFDDVLVRFIAVKQGIRDLRSFKRLAIYLLSNVGSYITGNNLKQLLGIKTTATVMDYLSYLEGGYLFYYLPMYSYSVRKQMINPRKVYATDTGLVYGNIAGSGEMREQLLENLVFLSLRRNYPEMYYFKENYSCDFVVMNRNKVAKLVQVCGELKQDNLEKELNGLFEAMDNFDIQEATLVSFTQEDRFERSGRVVHVVPVHEFI